MDEKPEDECTGAEMMGTEQVLQSVEDALLDNGWDELVVRTDHGVWSWKKDPEPVTPSAAATAQPGRFE